MLIARTLQDLALARQDIGTAPALVPTMGALHDGHLALVQAARAEGVPAAVSIFVNPTQFNSPDDLARYPRDHDRDLALLREAGCELVWLPSAETMYPDRDAVRIELEGPAQGWEGGARPGHFSGVATVVTKLLQQVRPVSAYFGEKDWQQLQVIRSVAAALFIPVAIRSVPTVREADGLAMSSRNRFLTAAQRACAPALHHGLQRAARAVAEGDPLPAVLDAAREDLRLRGFTVDYLALVDALTLRVTDTPVAGARLIAAAQLGAVRLLDNIAVTAGSGTHPA